jgi:hydrogenase maturation protease
MADLGDQPADLLTIIGCGNRNRSDDGVGVVVVQQLMQILQSDPRPDVRIFDAGTGGIDVMFRARGARRLVLVDASRSGSEPGAVFRVPGEELATDHQPTYSLHDFRWDHALHAGRKIFGAAFPSDITVFLIEIESIDLGTQLSASVARAATLVVRELQKLIDEHGTAARHHGQLPRRDDRIDP